MKSKFLLMIISMSPIFFSNSHALLFAQEYEIENKNLENIIREKVSLHGKIELEAEWSEDFNDEHNTNISLTSLEFDLQVQFTEWSLGKIVFDWDDEKEEIIIDETYIKIGTTKDFPLFLQAGRYDLPFGSYEGNTISDPLTKEVFETKDDALLFGGDHNDTYAHFYVFDGETNSDSTTQFGGNIGYGLENDFFQFDSGFDVISSVLDGNIFKESLNLENKPGLAVHTQFGMQGFGIYAEYITALDDINGSKPVAWHLECSYVLDVMDMATFFSLSYSQTDKLAGFLPKRRIAATTGIEFFDGLMLTFEYAYDKDYNKNEESLSDAPLGGREASLFTAQIAYEF